MKRVFRFKKGEELEGFMTNEFLDVLDEVCEDNTDTLKTNMKITIEWKKV